MSITGTGVESDPYIVHSYDEIKTIFTDRTNYPITDNILYIELANDINCKDYGLIWTWDVVRFTPTASADRFIFNLNNHTIKNFRVTQSNYVFDGANKDYWDSNRIQNGIIKNIYLQQASGFSNRGIKYENVGISMVATGFTAYNLFANGTKFKRCGLNIVCNFMNASSKRFTYWGARGGSSAQGIFEYCNINLDVSNPYDGLWGGDYEDYPLKDCRITGKIVKTSGETWLLTRGGLRNCIIDVDFSESTQTGVTLSHYSDCSISNADKLSQGITSPATIRATSEQIVNGDWLRARGFPVVNVQTP